MIKQVAVSWFSCGAASAAATVLARHKYGDAMEAVYCRVAEEHPDNIKFIERFTQRTGIPVTILVNEKYDGSIINVFEERKFIKSQHGAPCTGLLKKAVRKSYKPTEQYDFHHIFGYTSDERESGRSGSSTTTPRSSPTSFSSTRVSTRRLASRPSSSLVWTYR